MNTPIRILNLFTIMDRGGAETMVMNYYRNIDRTKIQFDFMVHRSARGAYDDEIEALGGKIYRMPPIRPWSKGFAFVRKENMKYIHSKKRNFIDCIHYVSSSIFSSNKHFIKESPKKGLTVLAIIPGILLTCYIRMKTNQKMHI